jgi:hypothetical protein
LPAADGVKLWQRVEFVGVNPTVIRSRVWLVGTPEPSTWLLNITDDNAAEQTAGMVGVRMRNEDTGASQTFGVESYQATGSADPISQTPNPTGVAHRLYVVDDGLVSVYDIDSNNTLVKQFPIPEAGKRGVVVAPSRGLLYVSECGPSDCSGKHTLMFTTSSNACGFQGAQPDDRECALYGALCRLVHLDGEQRTESRDFAVTGRDASVCDGRPPGSA